VLTLDLETSLDLSVRLSAVSVLISGLEMLKVSHHFQANGVFSLESTCAFRRNSGWGQWTDRLLRPALFLQSCSALAVACLGLQSATGRSSLVLCIGSATLVRYRRLLGGDGAEQMATIIMIAGALAVVPWQEHSRTVASVTFIAAQLCLSYFAAGIAKLVSPIWRHGEALRLILATETHGHPGATRFLERQRFFAWSGCWAVILFETLFPVIILWPPETTLIALACGFVFHLGCALLMGLNSFLWSFPAAYPCLIAASSYWRS
jgi:hypothetical protein